jgi:hypothetical protein
MPDGVAIPIITPLPETAIDLPPAVAAVEVTPAPGTYPHRVLIGESIEIRARAFAPEGKAALNGVLRWRQVLAPRWQEIPLQELGENKFSCEWTPAAAADYEWCIELWAGDSNDASRPGSSGADVLQLLRADRAIAAADWSVVPRVAFTDLHALISPGAGTLLLPPIFPQSSKGLTGRDGAGHYSIDPDLGDTRSFGEFAAAARTTGKDLALTIPLECSSEHPLRQRFPHAFANDGAADFTTEGWRELWSAWESVFRFWLVQGIDIFHFPRPATAPVSFWQTLLEDLRDDFPSTIFTAPAAELAAFGEHLLGAGFVASPQEERSEAPIERVRSVHTDNQIAPLPPLNDQAPSAEVVDALTSTQPTDTLFSDEQSIACSCSNPALAPRLVARGEGYVLHIENSEPGRSQSGHVHFDCDALGLTEHDLYYMRDLADGRAYRWSGTTNFLSLASGDIAKTFRLERS